LTFTSSCVLGEELDSQLGHLCRIVSLIFGIDVLQFKFLIGERNELRDKTRAQLCVRTIERISGRGLVVMESEPEESTSTRERGVLYR
jgi:hypothetical protein